MTRTSLRLDARGWKELAEATQRWLREAEEIEEVAATRLAGNGADDDGDAAGHPIDAGLVVMLFEAQPFGEHPPEAAPGGGRRGAAQRRSAPGHDGTG
jgi:hypothetical protein